MEENDKIRKISEINKRIFGKGKEYSIIDTYDYLMTEYGYIPYEEFKKMDAGLVDELVIRINKRREEFNKKTKKR